MVKKFKTENEKYQYYSSNNADDDKEWEENNKKFRDRLDNISDNKEIYNKLIFNFFKENNIETTFDNMKLAKEKYGKYDEKIDYSKYLYKDEPIKKSRMKTKIVDNSKAIERRRKRDEIFEHDKNLTDKKTIQRLIDHVIKNVSEPLPPKPRKRKMKTKKIVEYIPEPEPEPVKKKRGRPSIPQEIKEQKKLEKIQKAKEEKERKQEEKEYAEREFNRKQAGKIHAEKQYKENKIEYKKLKKYIREENETGGVDKKTMNKYNDLKSRIKEYEDRYINNVV